MGGIGKSPQDLMFSVYDAMEAGERRVAPDVMDSLGITRLRDEPHPVAWCWVFLGCENVPDVLPSYIRRAAVGD
jgi:hypothetical protein